MSTLITGMSMLHVHIRNEHENGRKNENGHGPCTYAEVFIAIT
jgi:hypothetical protein